MLAIRPTSPDATAPRRYHPPMLRGKGMSPADEDGAYAAAQRVVDTHRRLAEWLRRGQTLAEVDRFVAATLDDLKCKSCFLGYKVGRKPPFPSHACLSVNDCIVHGTAATLDRPLQPGDVLKIDIGVRHRGWIGDAAWTYVFGTPSPTVERLLRAGQESLRRGIATMQPGSPLIGWARAVQDCVERDFGFHLVRGLGGHGYGRYTERDPGLHAWPFVSNTVPANPADWPDGFRQWKPGILVAVEPMIAVGTGETRPSGRDWPEYTADGSLSVHFEHDVLIREDGPRILTEGLDDLPMVIER